MISPAQIARAEKLGLVNVPELARACEEHDLPFYVGCTIMSKETGGKNIYGHDAGGVFSDPNGREIEVTEQNFAEFIRQVRIGKRSNGVGPMQLTWPGFFDDMENQGLLAWKPADNISYGVGLLATYYHDSLEQAGKTVEQAIFDMAKKYNGNSSYGTDAVTVARRFRTEIGADEMSVDTVEKSSYGDIFSITIKKGDQVLAAADKAGHKITRIFGANPAPSSDHRFKQCVDFMHYGNTSMREWLENYLIDNHHRLGVMGLISNKRCMGFPAEETVRADCEVTWNGPAGVWRDYPGSDPHTDHVHAQFNTAAIRGSDPVPTPPVPKKYPKPDSGEVFLSKLRSGELNSDSVYYWQMALNAISLRGGEELKLDGDYRGVTVDETKRFQQQVCHDKADGWPGQKQALLAFSMAEREMKSKGVATLKLYDDPQNHHLIRKVW